MKIKIAHCSDLHIGTQISNLEHKSAIRAQEIKNSFLNIINICNKEEVKILCIAGDLFDDTLISNSEIDEIKKICQTANFKIIISPGNHDPYSGDSPYKGNWPENVFIFKNGILENITFDELKIRVFGAAFSGRYQHEPLITNVIVPNDDYLNICVIHGEIVSSNKSDYNPIVLSSIENSGFNYIALGHIHKRSNICKAGNVFYAYSGNPESTGFDELGEKGFYIGEISKEHCKMDFIKSCKRMYLTKEINISGLKINKEITQQIIKTLSRDFGSNFGENIYKIILTGEVSENTIINTQSIKADLDNSIFYCKIEDNTELEIDFKNTELRNDFKGLFIKKMIQKINTCDESKKDIFKKALKLGLASFEGDVKYNEN